MHSLDAFFAAVRLPSMPEVAHGLIQTLNDDNTSLHEVHDLISRDPALSARLLRLANSAQFGLQRGVYSIDEAIQMVGLAQVRTLALSACMSDAFEPLPGLDLPAFWRHSMACAAYAQWLTAPLEMDGQQAWLTGMMLRLGELLIGQANPQALAEIERLPHPPGARWEREKRLIGFSEGQITAELARRWNFPMQIVQALERAYDPLVEQAYSRLGAVVNLAGLLADTPDADELAVDALPNDVINTLGLEVRWMKATFPAPDTFLQLH
ncbi:HDOD domain-containing protein [Rhodoferax sp. U11-2br]|uniref:HDOD domain-containing protein n=1 Tax=Rhodoferax sp. U11-2br TaxID=2838878 RepID=UPI001BE7AEB2|nr:HDOD domain-containing protein [Rhodoferax sp. U11-2br]MBT3066147.1 HDOD domain-containing protein [Rhodoferax sp. U11-2br]